MIKQFIKKLKTGQLTQKYNYIAKIFSPLKSWREKQLTQEHARVARALQLRAENFFSYEQQRILKSTWGASRLQELSRKYNKNKDPSQQVSVNNFAEVIKSFEKQGALDAFSDTLNTFGKYKVFNPKSDSQPDISRNKQEQAIVQQVLKEGKDKTPEELALPALRLVYSQNKNTISNKK